MSKELTWEELKEKCLKLGDKLRDDYIWVPYQLELHKDGDVYCGDFGCLIAEDRSYDQMWQIRKAISKE